MPTPLSAFDIAADGRSSPAPDTAPAPAAGAAWRWLHFEYTAPGFADWALANLPATPAVTLSEPETRPRCDPYGDGLIVVLRAVNRNPGQDADDMVALRLWVTPTLVVSTRHRRVYAAERLRDACAAGTGPATPAAMLAHLASDLTGRIEALSLDLEDRTDRIEDEILSHRDVAEDLAPLRATAIKLRRHVWPQRDALARLAAVPAPLTTEADRNDLRETANRLTRSVEEIDSVAQRLTALQDHALAQSQQQMARNSFVLSIVAAVFLPLGFLTGLFGVNLAGMPGTDTPWAFAALVVVSVAIGVGLAWLFRMLRWF